MSEIVKTRRALNAYFEKPEHRSDYDFKRDCIQNSLYGVDIDPGAVEIAKLRLWLSLIVDEEDIIQIKPLPNLDYKIVCGNSLLGVERNLVNTHLFEELEVLKEKHFSATHSRDKKKLNDEIKELLSIITNGNTQFYFHIYFSEVFKNNRGFDVVIGNPPYGGILSDIEKKTLDFRFKNLKTTNKNTAIYFVYIASQLICTAGLVSFIIPKSICYSQGWFKCASFLINGLLKLIDTGKAFENVKLEQVIFIYNKTTTDRYYITGQYQSKEVKEYGEIEKSIFLEHKVLLAGQQKVEINLIRKIINNFTHIWSEYVIIERGLNWQSLCEKYAGVTPVYRGAQLFKYHLGSPTDHININKFNIKEYRYQLNNKILNQLAIAHVQNPYPHFYLQAALDTSDKLVFETISCTVLKKTNISLKFLLAINNSLLFAWLLYKFIYSNAIRSTRYDQQYVGRIPCPDFVLTEQQPFIDLVDQILAITKDDDYLQNAGKKAKVKALEDDIDEKVYQLYNLTPEEKAIVEGKT